MSTKIASLHAEIGADTSGLEKGIGRSKQSLGDLSKQWKLEAKSFESVQKQKTRAYDEYARQLTRQYREQEKQAKAAARAQKEQFQELKNTGMTAIAVVAALTAAAVKAYNAFQDYAGSVRDLSIATGTTAQEASTLLQVLDDYEITAEDVTAATKKMKDNGLVPTLETLAQLSDQFLAIQDPAKRLEFAQDNLGKSYSKYLNALSQGGDVLRANAAEVNKNLILTDEQIKQAELSRLAVDEWADAWEGLKVSIGSKIGTMIISNKIDAEAQKIYQANREEIEKQTGAVISQEESIKIWGDALLEAKKAIEGESSSVQNSTAILEDNEEERKKISETLSGQIGLINSMQSAEDNYIDTKKDLQEQFEKEAEALYKLQEGYYVYNSRGAEISNRLSDVTEKINGFVVGVSGSREELKELNKEQGVLTEKLGNQELVWASNTEEIEKQKEKVAEILEKTRELEEGQLKQSRQFVSNILAENLARDGWTQNEFDAFAEQQEAWGLWSADVVEKSKAAWMEADKIAASIEAIPTEKTVQINVLSNPVNVQSGSSAYQQYSQGEKPYANGGSFIVPGQYGYEGFNMGGMATASAGETVTITPKGQQQQQSSGGFDESRLARIISTSMTQALVQAGIGR